MQRDTIIAAHADVEPIRAEAGYIIGTISGDGCPVQTGAGPDLDACRKIAEQQLLRNPDARIGVFALVSEFTAPRTATDDETNRQPG